MTSITTSDALLYESLTSGTIHLENASNTQHETGVLERPKGGITVFADTIHNGSLV